jgi:hypothetical protein
MLIDDVQSNCGRFERPIASDGDAISALCATAGCAITQGR